MNPNNNLVIMAGGVGSRFWPMSTPECPKQFIDVMGCGRTFIQLTLDRFRDVVAPENVWVVTSQAYADIVREQLPEVPAENILLEPCRRNTAPCIAYVSWKIKKKNPRANLVITPSDHMVTDVEEFRRVIKSALSFTAQSDAIVTLGMHPTRPETGYGYIQADMSSPSLSNRNIYRVDRFREKPDLETAKKYITQAEYFWNSGIFVWNVETIVQALRYYEPEVSEIFEGMLPYYGTPDEQAVINERFPQCKSISIDYAVMEKAEEIYVFPASFGWSDVGTWGSLITLADKDREGNACIGPRIEVHETHNCIIHTSEERRVVVQGLDGYIVAEKGDTLLICKLTEEQRIKEFSAE
ncbi:MAG: mannose-1-phosphate guanylyltransferase [Bacteroidaceae bacterium]|nr:mannose-1-phosphate guanylyltransferase [Bacteroidaceae bacterium]MBQ9176388.1 mannose-1-phosphate guanylyltransferase [Bacteroidaceae bacterium]MBR1378790.1 mannose-1-phosphate guanylyltransferase [Bacteroidaceae bacterium]